MNHMQNFIALVEVFAWFIFKLEGMKIQVEYGH